MPIPLPLRRLTAAGIWFALAAPRMAGAATESGTGSAGLNTVGTPAVDFSPGTGAQPESSVYVWVDSAGVTHFTDQTGEFLGRYRDRFQPVDLFVNTIGQPKR